MSRRVPLFRIFSILFETYGREDNFPMHVGGGEQKSKKTYLHICVHAFLGTVKHLPVRMGCMQGGDKDCSSRGGRAERLWTSATAAGLSGRQLEKHSSLWTQSEED